MSFNLELPGKEPEKHQGPQIIESLDDEILRLSREAEQYPSRRDQVQHDFDAEIAAIRDKHNALLQKLAQENRERNARLQELRDLKKKREAEDLLWSTAEVVREIVANFPAWASAHPYQVEDIITTVHAYREGKSGMLNANDLGLGKTFESIVTLYILTELFKQEHGRVPRILWLTKSSILKTGSTNNEFKRWWDSFKIMPIHGSTNKKQRETLFNFVHMMNAAVITNYETVRTTEEAKVIWDIVVMDEVHKLKGGANAKPTAIFTSVKEVCQNARFVLMLSGTPMVNKPEEMWSYLHIFDPVRFPNMRHFQDAFCDYRMVAGEYQLSVNPTRILEQALRGQMIRRRRDEVGLQLPELMVEDRILLHNPDQADVYRQMREEFFIWLEGQEAPLTATAIIAQLTRLRQINVLPSSIEGVNVNDSAKIDEAMDIIEAAQDQVVVFSTFNEPMREIQRRCEQIPKITEDGVGHLVCKVIDGEHSKEMGGLETAFKNGEIDVLCINASMGEGLNLQKNPENWKGGASIGIFLDLWWNPARNDQCIGRLHRQGANQPVTIYRLLIERSIDYFILDKITTKAAQFDSIMESDEIRPASDWRDYLEGLI